MSKFRDLLKVGLVLALCFGFVGVSSSDSRDSMMDSGDRCFISKKNGDLMCKRTSNGSMYKIISIRYDGKIYTGKARDCIILDECEKGFEPPKVKCVTKRGSNECESPRIDIETAEVSIPRMLNVKFYVDTGQRGEHMTVVYSFLTDSLDNY